MARVTLTQFTNGTIADAPAVNNELAKLATQINGGLDSTNLTAGVLDNTIFSAAYDPVARAKDVVSNFVVSGLTIATSASLSTTVLAGVYYVSGKKVTISNTPITVVASKDTYIDLKDDGSVVQVAVANGATSGMTLTLNSDGTNALRIALLVSSGTAITTSTQTGSDPIGNVIFSNTPIQGAGSWRLFTPTFANLTVGNGTLVAKYQQIGKLVNVRVSLIFGSTTTISGDVTITHPVASPTYAGLFSVQPLGIAHFYNNGAAIFTGLVSWASTTTAFIRANNAGASSNQLIALAAGVPFTWANTHQFGIQYTYEAA